MYYTVDQLTDAFRQDVDDQPDTDDFGNPVDALWSDAEILRYLNAAAARLASDTLALRATYRFQIAGGAALVRFPFDRFLDILRITFSVPGYGRLRALHEFDLDTGIVQDDYGSSYTTMPDLTATGMPSHFSRDHDADFLRLWPVPSVPGELAATATVLPDELYAGMLLPFSAVQDRDLLLLWMKKLAYAKQDADTLDLERSVAFEAEYQRAMPLRRSEIDRTRRNGGMLRTNSF